MAETTQVIVSKLWSKVSDGNCTIQAIQKGVYDIAVGATEPIDDACIKISLNEPTNFSYASPVWCKLPQGGIETVKINVIK